LGVATWAEAMSLRQDPRSPVSLKKPVWIFAETPPLQTTENALSFDDYLDLCERHNFVPMVHEEDLLKAIMRRRQKFHIKINTGMNRLGLDLHIWQKWAKQVVAHPGLEGLLTHMAVADDAQHSLSQRQSALFKEALACLHGRNLPYIHFASTSVLANIKNFNLHKIGNVFRPGIGLYGYGLEADGAWQKKLTPAMKWKARVLKCRTLHTGDWVGYGGTFRVPGQGARAKQQEAVVGCGYGDGISRAISNGQLAGRSVLGRVSMDLICLEGGGLQEGDWVTILGESPAQALAWAKEIDTIVYEILTAVSERVPRIYK
jgi:alanine racemase